MLALTRTSFSRAASSFSAHRQVFGAVGEVSLGAGHVQLPNRLVEWNRLFRLLQSRRAAVRAASRCLSSRWNEVTFDLEQHLSLANGVSLMHVDGLEDNFAGGVEGIEIAAGTDLDGRHLRSGGDSRGPNHLLDLGLFHQGGSHGDGPPLTAGLLGVGQGAGVTRLEIDPTNGKRGQAQQAQPGPSLPEQTGHDAVSENRW